MTIEQLEQQAQRNRAAVSDTLEELNSRLTPGQIVDQVMGYMKNGGSDFLTSLGKQVTDNPLPVTLVGAGLAWFLFARNPGMNSGMSGNGSYGRPNGNGASTMNKAADAASSAAGAVGDMATQAADGVSGAMNAVGDAASEAYHQAADTFNNVKDSAIQVEQNGMAAARSAIAYCQEQPLVLAGLGLALGAALGAALPSTDIENELLGDTSDEMKEAAKDMAVDQLGKAKAVGAKLGEAMKSEASEIADDIANSSGIPMDEKQDADATSRSWSKSGKRNAYESGRNFS